MSNNYTVYCRFKDGTLMIEKRTDENIGSCLQRLIKGPASSMIKEIKVVDQLDCTNFLFSNGRIIFPTQKDI